MNTNLGQITLLTDINPDVGDGGNGNNLRENYIISDFFEFNDKVYFTADDDESGREIWVSDGTREGTQLAIDVNPGSAGSYPGNLIEFNDRLYFIASNNGSGRQLFVSDGTREGTQLLVDLAPGLASSYSNNLIEFNDKLYFIADDGDSGGELFVSDGTADGTQLLAELAPDAGSYPSNFIEFNDQLYFTANNGESGRELFVSDGTREGTQLLVDLYSGSNEYSYPNSSSPRFLVESDDKLYFFANDGESGEGLFVSDGTSEGTQLLIDTSADDRDSLYVYRYYPTAPIEFNDKLYFAGNNGDGRELFVSDGTREGTQLVVDLNPDSSGNRYSDDSNPSNFIVFNDKLYFAASDPEKGREIFVSDGTAAGTQLAVDLRPGSSGSSPDGFVEFNDRLYFTANNSFSADEIYATDGTAEGTQLIARFDSDLGDDNASSFSRVAENISNLTVVGDELFFTADDAETGRELYKLAINEPIAIDGSEEDDNLIGSDDLEQIYGFGGDDTIDAVGGNDTIDGGDGSDRILGSSTGNDSLFGGNGNDIINSGNGIDILNGGSGNDSLTSASGNDSLLGGNGNDTLSSGMDADTLNGGRGQDFLRGNSGNDVLLGGGGFDTLEGNSGRDTLLGDSGNDTIIGGSGDDSLIGGNNNDYLDGGAGNDILNGSSGDDLFILRTDAGSDIIMDFTFDSDRFGLADGLEFDSLSFSGNDILSGGEILASLNGIDTKQLTEVDFRTI